MKGRYKIFAYKGNNKNILDAFSNPEDAIKLAEGLKTYLTSGKLFTKEGDPYDLLTVVDDENNTFVWTSLE